MTIAQPLSSSTFLYDPDTLALNTETIAHDLNTDGTPELTRVLDRSQDSLNRDTGWDLENGSTMENSVTYTYSPIDGRLKTVTGAGLQPTGQFTYEYEPNSYGLVKSLIGPAHTVTNTWETNRDVLDIKENKAGGTVVSRYGYEVNELGQRTGVTSSGTAFPATPSWIWGYDSLGQVTLADSSVNTSDRAYQYDTIGNRIEARDGVTAVSGMPNYSADALNQYTAIDALAPDYDDDGNATSYPLPAHPAANSTLTWDAENRLISAIVNGTSTTYLYDAQSRRIAKTVGTGGSAGPMTTLYLYDGWNCIAEYIGTTLSKTRTWGLDLSGSLQGAGGVGGLLAERHHDGTAATYHPTYDGNGNVSEYLDANGTPVAHYEYDPFGRTIIATYSKAGDFAHRFSTKPLDGETGLYYYGYRYYDPVTGRWPSRDPIRERGGITDKSLG